MSINSRIFRIPRLKSIYINPIGFLLLLVIGVAPAISALRHTALPENELIWVTGRLAHVNGGKGTDTFSVVSETHLITFVCRPWAESNCINRVQGGGIVTVGLDKLPKHFGEKSEAYALTYQNTKIFTYQDTIASINKSKDYAPTWIGEVVFLYTLYLLSFFISIRIAPEFMAALTCSVAFELIYLALFAEHYQHIL